MGEETNKHGHEKMIVWQMADKLDEFVQKQVLPTIPRQQYKTISQIDNASDSIGANFVEGYYSGSIGDYIRFLRYSKRSCGELMERVRRCLRKQYITQTTWDKFHELSGKTMYLFNRLISSLETKRDNQKKPKSVPYSHSSPKPL